MPVVDCVLGDIMVDSNGNDGNGSSTSQQMSMLERRFNLYGLPIILLALFFYAGNNAAKWLAPKADAVIVGHVDFMHKAGIAIEEQAKNGAALAKQSEVQSQILERQEQRLGEIHRAVTKQTP